MKRDPREPVQIRKRGKNAIRFNKDTWGDEFVYYSIEVEVDLINYNSANTIANLMREYGVDDVIDRLMEDRQEFREWAGFGPGSITIGLEVGDEYMAKRTYHLEDNRQRVAVIGRNYPDPNSDTQIYKILSGDNWPEGETARFITDSGVYEQRTVPGLEAVTS